MPLNRVMLTSGVLAFALAGAQSAAAADVEGKAAALGAHIEDAAGPPDTLKKPVSMGPEIATAAGAPPTEGDKSGLGADIGTMADAGPTIAGSVTGPALTNGQLDTPLGDGFDAEKWELDETLGKPVIAIADRGLAEKGHPEGLSGLGADTASMQQGLSLQGASTPAGAMASTPVVSSVLGSLNDIPGL